MSPRSMLSAGSMAERVPRAATKSFFTASIGEGALCSAVDGSEQCVRHADIGCHPRDRVEAEVVFGFQPAAAGQAAIAGMEGSMVAQFVAIFCRGAPFGDPAADGGRRTD